MYSLLIADDEMIAVMGIKEGIDWRGMGIDKIYEAFDAEEALRIISKNRVDLLICDIEMPGLNGLELLDKVNEISADTVTIFLTGHARFDYAQLALKKGSFDYLLKPIDHKKIQETVQKALEKVKEIQEQRDFIRSYDRISSMWKRQQPILVERLWQDIFSKRILSYEHLASLMELYNLPIKADDEVIPVLLSIELWQIPLSKKDEEILKYGLRNMALEILQNNTDGAVFQNHDGNLVMIIYPNTYNGVFIPNDRIHDICKKIISTADRNLHCTLSCYIGEPVTIGKLEESYNSLLELERNNVQETNSVIFQSRFNVPEAEYPQAPEFGKWQLLFELGRRDALLEELDNYFRANIDKAVNPEVLESLYFGFMHMVYSVVHRNNLAVEDIYDISLLHDFSITKSYLPLQKRIKEIILQGMDYFENKLENNSAIINKIQEFIYENYKEKINRDEIASYVYLNPAYLSRLFKKETGKTLTEYITELRIEEAKRLLSSTDYTITAIAEEIGYYNYSYFSRIFKDIIGLTPGEYRKKFQGIEQA
ncbi:MAG: helix-turn-helix domain-containing protein [Halanaerobiaceae bacterium]|jgi:two-component system response regulator YesN|nr:helix-turn-helix domain-containing protein [Halanaerobiaceae bacterium]